MPKNLINIKDTTGEPLSLSKVKTIYIPGPSYKTHNPLLCTNVDDLIKYSSQNSKDNPLYPDFYIDNTSLSYKLAYYLISYYGFYVLYEGIGNVTSVPDTSFQNLKYSDYNIDFITTGQYGGVNTQAAACAEYRKDCTYLADHTNNFVFEPYHKLITDDVAPEDWETNYSNYYLDNNQNEYSPVPKSGSIPEWRPNTYYYLLPTDIEDIRPETVKYILTETKPDDWSATYSAYYTKALPYMQPVQPKSPAFENDKYYEAAAPTFIVNTYYEKTGSDSDTYSALNRKPDDWETKYYTKYYSRSGEDPNYTYTLLNRYTLLPAKPENWDTNYSDYYEFKEGSYVNVVGRAPTYEKNKYYIYVRVPTDISNYVDAVRKEFEGLSSDYAAGFTPWFKSSIKINNTRISDSIPASFGYLFAYANSIKTNPVWLAVAGPERGVIPELIETNYNYTRLDVERLQARASKKAVDLDQPEDNIGIAINPIANIRPFGTIIYGNRTLHYNTANGDIGELKASSFLNIRNLVSLIARTAYTAANRYKFDQNNSLLWNKFSSVLIPVLDSAVSGGGIVGYKLDQVKTKKKARLQAKLTIIPIEAVEDLELDIILTDSLEVEVG